MLNRWLTACCCVDHCLLSFLFSPLPLSIYGFRLPIWYLQPFDHCIVRPSLIYGFRLLLWYLQPFDHCIVRPSLIYGFRLLLWYLQPFDHSRAPKFTPGFMVGFVLLIFLVFCVVLFCIFTFSVSCCDIRYDFRIKSDVRFVFTSSCL